jgi:poly [ADP-ribose] polymerase 10/14/15
MPMTVDGDIAVLCQLGPCDEEFGIVYARFFANKLVPGRFNLLKVQSLIPHLTVVHVYAIFIYSCVLSVQVYRVQNPFLWTCYENKKVELSTSYTQHGVAVTEMLLFHGTKLENVKSICFKNFDWRRSGENVGCKYGQGVSFALDLMKSHFYSSPAFDGTRVVFLSKVLVGMSTTGTMFTRYPPAWRLDIPCDTTVNNLENPTIFVKYETTEYYPAYVILYSGC